MDKIDKTEYIVRFHEDERRIVRSWDEVGKLIRCKDCRWRQGSECVRFSDVRPFPDDFCSRAELRGEQE